MLFNNGNPYRGRWPEALELGWDDFECGLSTANEQALGQVADWAIFAYMAADCNLASLMFDDLLDMKAVGSNPSMHVLALFDGPFLADSFFARLNAGTGLGEDIFLRFNELRTNEASTLTMALQVASAYPARRRLLLLGGHGSGWPGALIDENIGMRYRREPGKLILPGPGKECDARLQSCQLRVQERLNREIEKAAAPGRHYDVLAFDACYMGNIEAVAHFAGEADLLVVSEDAMPGEGFAYQSIMAELLRNPAQSPAELARYIVGATGQFYRSPGKPARAITLAALKAERLAPFSEAFVRLVQVLDVTDPASFPVVRNAMEKAWAFDATGTVDLKGFVLKLLEHALPPAVQEAARKVLEQWSELVLAFAGGGTAETTNGLSTYAPPADKFDMSYIELSNQLPLNFGIWAWFLGAYYLQLLGAEAPRHPLIQAFQRTMQDLMARGVYKPKGEPAAG